MHVGQWIELEDGSTGQVWSEGLGGWWIAVRTDAGSRWALVTELGRELGQTAMGDGYDR